MAAPLRGRLIRSDRQVSPPGRSPSTPPPARPGPRRAPPPSAPRGGRGVGEQVGAEVRGHDHHRVAEVHGPPLPIGEPPVVQELEEEVEGVGLGLLHLVQEDGRRAGPGGPAGSPRGGWGLDVAAGRRCGNHTRRRNVWQVRGLHGVCGASFGWWASGGRTGLRDRVQVGVPAARAGALPAHRRPPRMPRRSPRKPSFAPTSVGSGWGG